MAKDTQLKKVVLAIGNTLIYRDTYEQALAELSALMQGGGQEVAKQSAAASAAAAEPTLDRLRESIRRNIGLGLRPIQ